MKCPNCGKELEAEVYSNPKCFCLYCENGDFGTDYTIPSKAVEEVEKAYEWNAEMVGERE